MLSWFRLRKNTVSAKTKNFNVPNHVGIIMDGNGRWAQSRALPRSMGHMEGANRVKAILKEAQDVGVKIVTLYTFSTENWKRPQDEINVLFRLLEKFLKQEMDYMKTRKIRFQVFGDVSRLPDYAQKVVLDAVEESKGNQDMIINFCLNYGGRAEIVESVKRISEQIKAGHLETADITEDLISKNLYSAGLPDPDLIIRTSGELRTSNFLVWQSAYSEYYFSPVYWPDFSVEHFRQALLDYSSRDRRFGKPAHLKSSETSYKNRLTTKLGSAEVSATTS